MLEPAYRRAGSADAEAIARLHADSWRCHYRGAYSDAFLDGDVLEDRTEVWSSRLARSDSSRLTVIAERGEPLGFAHVVFDHDPVWGALLDNIHVAVAHKRSGIGRRLVEALATALEQRPRRTGLYLWVLEQNSAAQAFYESLGAECAGRERVQPPGGLPGRLAGSPFKLRYSWAEPVTLAGSPIRRVM